MKIKERNPEMNNVYPEIGSAFGTPAIVHPEMCQHLIGKNIKYYGADHVIWGTDCLWWGSPQWVIDAFKRFQITDELCEKFGYKKLTKEDKAKIFGLNAAKIYGVDPAANRNAFPKDTLSQLKIAYLEDGGQPETPRTAGSARTPEGDRSGFSPTWLDGRSCVTSPRRLFARGGAESGPNLPATQITIAKPTRDGRL